MGITDMFSGSGKVIKKIVITIAFLVFALGTPIFANDVRITQQLLTELGYNPGPIDGSYGDKTKRALENFYETQNQKCQEWQRSCMFLACLISCSKTSTDSQ